MKKQVCGIAALVLLAAAAIVTSAYAQPITAKIPFEFQAGKKKLPAGTYIITYGKSTSNKLTLRNESSSASVEIPVVTRLAAKEQSNLGPHLVFDKVDEDHSLAEFWLPGLDGFYLGGAMTTHSHVIIKAGK